MGGRIHPPGEAVESAPPAAGTGRRLHLTERQRREAAYHKRRALEFSAKRVPLSLTVARSARRRWWNSYWHLYTLLRSIGVRGRRTLVLGCGFGNDAILLSEMGAEVDTCDISPETVKLAKRRAEGRNIRFAVMPAETLGYRNGVFDLILADDILHHVEVRDSMREIERVAKPGCVLVWREVYRHTSLDKIRKSAFVDRFLYSRMTRWIYATNEPYITQDERPLTEQDIDFIVQALGHSEVDYFNFLIGRLFPDRFHLLCRMDRSFLKFSRLGRWLGCRCVGHGSLLAGRTVSQDPGDGQRRPRKRPAACPGESHAGAET
jgi:ubiquinone/menaquinone biosynthesis C-methylase UbiE